MQQRFEVDYTSIPGRWGLLRQMLTPAGRRKLPAVPNPIDVLQRCLVHAPEPRTAAGRPARSRPYRAGAAGREFHGFRSPLRGVRGGLSMVPRRIDELDKKGNPALAAILATKN